MYINITCLLHMSPLKTGYKSVGKNHMSTSLGARKVKEAYLPLKVTDQTFLH